MDINLPIAMRNDLNDDWGQTVKPIQEMLNEQFNFILQTDLNEISD